MKIESVYLSGFGAFKDYRLDFADGLNLLYGDNEDGKTTLMTFLRMMFYGNSAKGNDLSKNPRKKYAPWDGTPMAGSVDFTSDGIPYRLERTFKGSNQSDALTLINRLNGERSTFTGSSEIGLKFFGLTAQAFERCAFIGQFGAPDSNTDAEGEINTKLSAVSGIGSDQITAEKVFRHLTNAKEILRSRGGKKGEYDKNVRLIAELNESLQKAKQTEIARRDMALRYSNEKTHFAMVSKELDRLNGQLRAAESGKNYRKLKDYIQTIELAESLAEKLVKPDGNALSTEDMTTAEKDIATYKLLTAQSPALKEKIGAMRVETERLIREEQTKQQHSISTAKVKADELKKQSETLQSELSENEARLSAVRAKRAEIETKKGKVHPIFILLALLGIIVAAGGIVSPLLYVAGGGLAVVGLILTLTVRHKPHCPAELTKAEQSLYEQSVTLQSNLNTAKSALTNQTALITALTENAGNAAHILELRQKEQAEKELNLSETEQELTNIVARLSAILPNFDMNTKGDGLDIMLLALRTNLQKLSAAQAKLAVLRADLGNLTKTQAKEDLAAIPNDSGDPVAIRARLDFKQKECDQAKSDLAYFEAHLATDFRFERHPTETEHEIERLSVLAAKQDTFCRAADLAAEVLTDAANEARQSFGGVLTARASEIFCKLTGGAYSAMSISKDFNITVEKSGIFGSKEHEYLSGGTVDQAYFALRLAISELLSGDGEALPLFLDDPFCQYDDTRAATAVEFLKQYAEKNQVLFFTCHRSLLGENEVSTIR